MSQLDAVILSPPWSELNAISGPLLAPAQLSAYLSVQGMRSEVLDLNIRFFHWLARPDGPLDERLAQAVRQARRLTAARPPAGSEDERRSLAALSHLSNVPPEILAPALSGVKPAGGNPWLACDIPLVAPPSYAVVQFAAPPELQGETVSASIGALAHPNLFDDFYSTAEVRDQLARVAAARVIGVSISFPSQIGAGLRLARLVRGLSDAFIVLGGVTLTAASENEWRALAQLPFVDGLVVHAGELSLRRLVEIEGRRASLATVPGLVYSEAGTVHTTAVGPRVPASELPTPRFDDEAVALYPSGSALPVLVTRGCYWDRCVFCDERKFHHPGEPVYDLRAADQVVGDIRALVQRHAIVRFSFVTDAAPPSWCEKLVRSIEESRLRIEFWTFLKNHQRSVFTPQFARRMKAAGLGLVSFGVESFAPRVLELMNKGTTHEDRVDNVRTFAAAGVPVHINLIPDFPTSSREEAVAGLRTLLENRDSIALMGALHFGLEHGTVMSEAPHEYGLEVLPDDDEPRRNIKFRRTAGMTDGELREILAAYEEMEGGLALHRRTANNRDRIAGSDFSWPDATVSLRRFSILEEAESSSARPLGPAARGTAAYVIISELALSFPVSTKLLGFLRALRDHHSAVLSFAALDELYASSTAGADGSRAGLIPLLDAFVRLGLVQRVDGGTFSAPPLVGRLLADDWRDATSRASKKAAATTGAPPERRRP